MAEEKRENENQEERTPEEILAEMREKMVPKEEAEGWKAKYNKLFADVASGSYSSQHEENEETPEEAKKRVSGLVESLAGRELHSATESVSALLEIDTYYREAGKPSIFEPSVGQNEETRASADRVRDVLQDALDRSNGSDEVLCATLGSRLSDPFLKK